MEYLKFPVWFDVQSYSIAFGIPVQAASVGYMTRLLYAVSVQSSFRQKKKKSDNPNKLKVYLLSKTRKITPTDCILTCEPV